MRPPASLVFQSDACECAGHTTTLTRWLGLLLAGVSLPTPAFELCVRLTVSAEEVGQ